MPIIKEVEFFMRFKDLDVLVDYVCSGSMTRDDIPDTIVYNEPIN